MTDAQLNFLVAAIRDSRVAVHVPPLGLPDVYVAAPEVNVTAPAVQVAPAVPLVRFEVPPPRLLIAIMCALFTTDIILRIMELARNAP